jgi:MarR family transcriptional regulator, transcriptional regulator for hemolysin
MTDLLFLLNQASHALANQMAARLADVGLSPRDYCVLSNAQARECTQIQLAERSALDKTTMVVALDHLERGGLAQRRPSATDRRVRIVAVTDAGADAVARARTVVQELYDDVLGELAPEQREALLAGLTKLVDGPLAAPSHVERPVRRSRAKQLVPS